MLVPEHSEYVPLVPVIVLVHWEAAPMRRAEAISSPGAATVGTHRPSTAGPRLLKPEIESMLPAR